MVKRNWLIESRGRFTQCQIALLAGISRSAYSNIEIGKRDPSVATAKAIARALGFEWNIFFEQKCFARKLNGCEEKQEEV
jgi:transcriptional regulator with XRE-family HTH domain